MNKVETIFGTISKKRGKGEKLCGHIGASVR